MLSEHVLQYNLVVLHNFPIARLDEGAQQINHPAQPQIDFTTPEHHIDGLAHVLDLVVVTDDQLPVVPVYLLDDVGRDVVKGPLALKQRDEDLPVLCDDVSQLQIVLDDSVQGQQLPIDDVLLILLQFLPQCHISFDVVD